LDDYRPPMHVLAENVMSTLFKLDILFLHNAIGLCAGLAAYNTCRCGYVFMSLMILLSLIISRLA
jgi:hypothetical protein